MPKEIRDRQPRVPKKERPLGAKKSSDQPWNKQEKRLAEASGGRTTIGSGNKDDKGDVHFGQDLLIEAKFTSLKSFRLDQKLLEKISREAEGKLKVPALAVEFEGMPLGTERDWIMVPKSYLLDKTE